MTISEQTWKLEEELDTFDNEVFSVVDTTNCDSDDDGRVVLYESHERADAEAIAHLPDIVRAMLEQRERIRRWQQGVYVEDFCVDMGESLDEIDALLERLGEKP